MSDPLTTVLHEALPERWSHDAADAGWSFMLRCPHGHWIEQDGTCPDGCVSPLGERGLI